MRVIFFCLFFWTLNHLAACPNIHGNYAEDDYRMKIEQDGCNIAMLKGGYLLQRFQLTNLRVGEGETLCFKDAGQTRYCESSWENNELVVNIRSLQLGKEYLETLKLLRCDYAKEPGCKYAQVK